MLNLYGQYKSIKREIDESIKNVIKNQAFIGGRYVEIFENSIARFCGTKFAVSLNSGTDALYLSLWSLGIGKGDEIITSPFTFIATAEAISRLDAKPVFVDIDPSTFNINYKQLEEKITKKTKAIIPVHLFGQPADMDEINKLARKYKLYVVEDAAQAIGAKYNNINAGNLGDIGCFSFYPSKNLGGYGDGGIVTTNKKTLAEKIRILKNHGSIIKYRNEIIGVSSRLDGIQASILSAKLFHLEKWNRIRRNIAKKYNRELKNIQFISIPFENGNVYHVYHQYTIRVKQNKRDRFKKYLEQNNISSIIYYPTPLHLLKAMQYLCYKKGNFPEAERASKEVLSLPIYPEMTDKQISCMVRIIKKFK